MNSNAWSNRRHAPGRPQVCETKPPLPPAAAELICGFAPDEITMQEFETQCTDYSAFNPKFGPFDSFSLSYLGSNPNFSGPTEVLNGGIAAFCYSSNDGPGGFVFAVEVTDLDGNKCIGSVEFTVDPFGGPPP